MSVVIPSFYQHAFQCSSVSICSVAKALREERAEQANQVPCYISQAILSVHVIGSWHVGSNLALQAEEWKQGVSWKGTFSSSSAGPSFSFLWQPRVPSDDNRGILLKLSGFEYTFTSALFLWTVEVIKMHGVPIRDCKEVSITWCLDNVCSFHWAFICFRNFGLVKYGKKYSEDID